jgi:CRISPR-associated protein Cas1
MSWRNILVASPAKLSLAQQHLHIAIGDEEIDVPLEDISVIIIENLQTLLTGQIISELAQRGIGVIICDERHLPCGELLPFHQHSRMRKALSFQLEMTEPFRKNCWRLIIHRKILNQAICLDLLWKTDGDSLRSLASGIRSGDPDNRKLRQPRFFSRGSFPALHDEPLIPLMTL